MSTSYKSVAAFLSALLAIGCGVFSLLIQSDLFLIGILVFFVLANGLGIWGLVEVNLSDGILTGKPFAISGIALPYVGFALGFLLLPVT